MKNHPTLEPRPRSGLQVRFKKKSAEVALVKEKRITLHKFANQSLLWEEGTLSR